MYIYIITALMLLSINYSNRIGASKVYSKYTKFQRLECIDRNRETV